ncbi:erythrocyte membrane protein 1 [Plasmodium falciparum RAJ116]|uniref:Erythrocyte membrane protein 1 n=1 Tax=Plasmodium falciparum RAJ116 TaxID=580058 RepID=A0A0L0CUN1_PLAFA|nr:erythrocyte membrane protein 1 [Plasmodium falciparum RAJ116]
MGPKKPVALRGGGGGEDIDKTSAKHLLDNIGKRVHAQVQNEAAGRGGSELKGLLSLATFSSEEMGDTNDPCIFNYTKVIKATDNNETCGKGKEDRFSKNRIAEYDKKKIRGNNGGASAPYRKLSLCNKNLETINIDKIDNKQKLLADVCFAAKHEGESISDYYPQYQTTYGNFPFELCTVLARRFADIGDIIRGKDLFYGNTQESAQRKKLDDKLKEIFKEIHDEVTKGRSASPLQARYQGDDNNNYSKLRKDWWTANRETVWKALTCKADTGNAYFRPTCDSGDGKGPSQTHNKCTCNNGDVPTYFDYVPQYLRWFEE